MHADIESTNHGTIITIQPASTRGRSWMRKHVPESFGRRVECDHRFGVDILIGAIADGLTLRDTTSGRMARQS